MKTRRIPSVLPFALAGLLVLIADRITKVWALEHAPHGSENVHWIVGHMLGLHLQYNYGASFSFGESATWVFTLIGLATVLVLPFFAGNSLAWALTLGVVWGGALGNLADRLFAGPFGRGPVTDFLVYASWFTGNVADIALVLGVIALVVLMAKGYSPFTAAERQSDG